MVYRFDDCVLDAARRELRRANMLRCVKPRVFDLLERLVRRDIVSRGYLLKAISRGHDAPDAVLGTGIHRRLLRKL